MSNASMVVDIIGNDKSLSRALDKAGEAAKRASDNLKKVEGASKGLDKAGDSATRAASKIKTIEAAGAKLESVGKKMTLGVTTPLVAIGALSLKSAGDFQSSMAQFRVATGLSAGEVGKFSDLAKKMGADTTFSAQEAAGAMLELAKGGLKPAQIESGALKASMDLAAAGGLGLAEAGTAVSTAMNTFGMSGSEAATIADSLAGAANSSAANVDDLMVGLQQTGQQAAASGMSLQETTAALAAFSDAGLKGSDAGTSLKTMLQRLAAPTGAAADTMKELGLKFFDAKGKMVPLQEIAGQLQTKLKGLTQEQRLQALQTMFGADATRAANILFEKGAAGIGDYIKATSASGGAAEMAKARMEGWAGASEQLSGSIETAALAIGEALAPAASDIAGKIQGVVNWFSSLDKGTQETIVKFGAVAAAIGPVLWGLGAVTKATGNIATGFRAVSSAGSAIRAMLVGKTAATVADTAATTANTAAQEANAAAGRASSGAKVPTGAGASVIGMAGSIAAVTTAAVAGGYAFHQWVQGAHTATEGATQLQQAAQESGGALTEQSRAAADAWLAQNNLGSAYKSLKVDADTVRSAVLGNKGAMDQVNGAIGRVASATNSYVSTGAGATSMMSSQGDAINVLSTKMQAGYDSTKEYTAAQQQLRDEQQKLADQNLAAKLTEATEGFQLGSVHAQQYARQVVELGRAAGKSDAEISKLLGGAGASPKQIKIALSADPTKIQADISTAKTALNGLKQYRKPEIRAEVKTLESQLKTQETKLNSLKQSKKPNIDAINKVAARVTEINGQIASVKQRNTPKIKVEVSSARTNLGNIISLMSQITDKTVTVTAVGSGISGSLQRVATGGPASGMAIVGERGPELVSLPEGSQVYTHSQSLRMMAGDNYAKGKKKLTKKQQAAKDKQDFEDAKRKRIEKLQAKKDAQQSALDALRGTVEQRASLSDLAAQRQGIMDKITGSVSSFTGIGGFDPGARADALAELQSAQAEVNTAGVGTSARASALSRLSAAQTKMASAPASVREWLSQRVDKVRRWRDVINRLKGSLAGTTGGRQLLQEIYDKGPDGGVELGEELLRNPSDLTSLVNLQNDANWLGSDIAGNNPGVIDLNNAYAGQQREVDTLQTIVVQMDGQIVAESLLKYKARRGGRSLEL